MVIFYRERTCRKCDMIEKGLKDMNISHKIVTVAPDAGSEILPSGREAPFLTADGDEVEGDGNILRHLDLLRDRLDEWHEHQAGCCFGSCDDSA